MRTELSFFNDLDKVDKKACREHFLNLGVFSSYYSSLHEALSQSIDWENLKEDSPDYYYFHHLLEETKQKH